MPQAKVDIEQAGAVYGFRFLFAYTGMCSAEARPERLKPCDYSPTMALTSRGQIDYAQRLGRVEGEARDFS